MLFYINLRGIVHDGRHVGSTADTSVHSVYLMYVATDMQYRFTPSEFAKVHAYVIFNR